MGELTNTTIQALKATGKPYTKGDGEGLSIHVDINGNKTWRSRFTLNNKPTLRGLGSYPEVSLAQAREKNLEYRKLAAQGIDYNTLKKIEKDKLNNTFERVAKQWLEDTCSRWVPKQKKKVVSILERYAFPAIGNIPVHEINSKKILTNIKQLQISGKFETAKKYFGYVKRVFKYAKLHQYLDQNPCDDLERGIIGSAGSTHLASIKKISELKKLLCDINHYQGSFVVRNALKLTPLLFVRPGELRKMEWSEIKFDEKEWHIPAEKMKMASPHIVPLSTQALAILEEIKIETGAGRYVFPAMGSRQGKERPMSENAINDALSRLGYQGKQTAHGFRSTASTLLNGMGYNKDWIERQLAHKEQDSIRAAYNHADYLPERKEMMQKWSDYLDSKLQD